MESADWTAAEKSTAAEDKARTDQFLRANSAQSWFTSIKQAQDLEEGDPEQANEKYSQAISWFRDVIHLQGNLLMMLGTT